MKSYIDCLPCLFSQAFRAARIAVADETIIKKVLDEVGMMMKNLPLENTPPESADLIYAKIREITGVADPYAQIKKESTNQILALYPELRHRIERSEDRLKMAVKMAIAGNVIDFGVDRPIDIHQEIKDVLDVDLDEEAYRVFCQALDKATDILYIGDNAGESVFDRILMEEINKPVTYVVRGMPIINDVTYDDALQAGIDEVAAIIASGTSAPGTCLEKCSTSFVDTFLGSDLIISKGQGNYEALSEETQPIFFLLKAKCQVIATDIGVGVGEMVLKGVNITSNKAL